ncbi:MAG: hypothetical protein ACK41E_00385 [Deinococcales bacterium]
MINLVLGVAMLGFGFLYLAMLPRVPAHQKTLMTGITAVNLLGGATVLTLLVLGILK